MIQCFVRVCVRAHISIQGVLVWLKTNKPDVSQVEKPIGCLAWSTTEVWKLDTVRPDFWDASITSHQSIYIPNLLFIIMCKFSYFFLGHRCKVLKHPHLKWHMIPLLIWYTMGTKIITVSSSLSPSPQLPKESGLGRFHVSPFIALRGEIGICQSALARHLQFIFGKWVGKDKLERQEERERENQKKDAKLLRF